jgi:hypothetical protein
MVEITTVAGVFWTIGPFWPTILKTIFFYFLFLIFEGEKGPMVQSIWNHYKKGLDHCWTIGTLCRFLFKPLKKRQDGLQFPEQRCGACGICSFKPARQGGRWGS